MGGFVVASKWTPLGEVLIWVVSVDEHDIMACHLLATDAIAWALWDIFVAACRHKIIPTTWTTAETWKHNHPKLLTSPYNKKPKKKLKLDSPRAKSPPFIYVIRPLYAVVWKSVVNWLTVTTRNCRSRKMRNLWLILER